MLQPSLATVFQDVDQHRAAHTAASCLRSVGCLLSTASYKRLMLDLLDLRPGERVLDAGCGTGCDLDAMANSVGKTGKVFGLDKSRGLLEEAAQRLDAHSNIHLLHADLEQIPLPDRSCDAIRIDRVLQHCRNSRDIIDELHRVLRSDGRIVAFDPQWDTLSIQGLVPQAETKIIAHWRREIVEPDAPSMTRAALFARDYTDIRQIPHLLVEEDLIRAGAAFDFSHILGVEPQELSTLQNGCFRLTLRRAAVVGTRWPHG